MSVFTNPASGAAEHAQAYISATLELVGDTDPLSILEATASELRASIDGLSNDRLDRPEAEGKWSIAEVLQHVLDTEVVWAYRLRKVLAENAPALEGFDQDAWVDRLRYFVADPAAALDAFAALRALNLAMLRATVPEDLERHSMHAERGRETLAHMLRLHAGHDLVHRGQVVRIRDGLG